MREDEVACRGVEAFGVAEKLADSVIGKMSGAGHDALLDVPGVGADFEHFEIVIGFENEAIGAAEMMFDEFGEITEIGDDGDFRAVAAEREADRIGGIVGNGEGGDFDIPDGEAIAGMKIFHVREAFVRGLRDAGHGGAMRGGREIDGGAPETENLRQAADMVAVFVGDDDAVEAVDACAERFEAAKGLAFAESGIDEETSAFRFEQGDVARTAGSQDGNADADAIAPRLRHSHRCVEKIAAAMMAGRKAGVNRRRREVWRKFRCGKSRRRSSCTTWRSAST